MTGVMNSTNSAFGNGLRVHVQTEIVSRNKLIVTCVMYKGQCLYRTQRSYDMYLEKDNLDEILPRVALAMHQKVLRELPQIYSALTSDQLSCIEERELQSSIRPCEVKDMHTAVLELLEEGLAACRTDPEKALKVWKEALGIEPTNRTCRTNINRLAALRRT